MGLLFSKCKESKCIHCDVPKSYYNTIEHSERRSCRRYGTLFSYHEWSK
jgi:hypothetical protein